MSLIQMLLGAASDVIKDLYYKYVTLLLHGDGTNAAQNNTFLDSSTNAITITRNGNATQGTFTPYSLPDGSWSNYFVSSASSRLQFPSGNIWPATGNFTIQFWFYPISTGASYYGLCSQGTQPSTDNGRTSIVVYSDARIGYGVGESFGFTSATGLVQWNQWQHVALTRSGNTFTFYFNGTSIWSGSSSKSIDAGYFRIGTIWDGDGIGLIPFNGYISNFRLTTTVEYSSNFTPSTTPLTAISGTSVLTCQSNRFKDNSTNAYTVTLNGTPQVQVFSPFPATSAYSAATNGGSAYFDGSGDYLNSATNSNLSLGTNSFTLEYWVNFSSLPGYFACVTGANGGGGWDPLFGWYQVSSSGGNLSLFLSSAGSSWDIASNVVIIPAYPALNTWHHVAITRNGSTFRTFWNGVQQSTFTSSASIYQSGSDSFNVGRGQGGGFNGYISDVRFINGTSLYNSSFTPPTAPLTAVSGTQLLISCTNAGIFDNAQTNDVETASTAQISTAQSKFGTGSMYFNGSTDYLKLPVKTVEFGTGDFTVEAWVYITQKTVQNNIMDSRSSSGGANPFMFSISGTNAYLWYWTGTAYYTTNTVPLNTWTHVAISRTSGTVKMFIDGVIGYSGSDTSNMTGTSTTTFNIGTGGPLTGWFNGYMDDFRITKGVGRYLYNFTPPTKAYPDIGYSTAPSSNVVTTGLSLHLDAANTSSYPGTGTVWYDLSGNGYNFNISASAYNSSGAKYMDFGGSYGCAKTSTGSDYAINGVVTAIVWTQPLASTGNWRTLFRGRSLGSDHQVIIQNGGYAIGMYDNTSGSGFNSSGFSQTSLPNYSTPQWQMMVWFWPSTVSPYYNLMLNGIPAIVGSNTSTNTKFKGGICSIGAYNNEDGSSPTNASQYWGNIGALYMYNRILTQEEILTMWNATRSRYGF